MNEPALKPSNVLATRLRSVRVGVRDDLEVSRHVFRGEVSYVIRDPMTFQSHRLDPHEYTLLCGITGDRTLGEIFDEFVRPGFLTVEDEEKFYQFVMGLHALTFLRLPVSDDALLYRRYAAKQRARWKEKLTGFLFLRIPLWNPNAFLDRTLSYARFLFGRASFLFWLGLMAAAAFVAFKNADRFRQPLEGLLVAQNLLILWLTLIVLKTFHEFGHAYACKRFGGHVPEMGAYLILFTPCAYVDATASWGFTRKRDRIIVCLAGMYVESIFAALAVFVWAVTDSPLIGSIAYNVIFLAGATTFLFNINPLMKYDGYYVLSDWLEIPNLRERAGAYLTCVAKRWLLGIPIERPPNERRLAAILFTFGVGAAIYRALLMVGIATVLAMKWFWVGVSLAVYYVGATLVGTIRRLIRYLWHSEETVPVRWRAVAIGILVLILLPAAAAFITLPAHVHTAGVLARENEFLVRAKTPGFLRQAPFREGQPARSGELIVELENDTVQEELADARSKLEAAKIRMDARRADDPNRFLQEQAQTQAFTEAAAQSEEKLAELRVFVPADAVVVEIAQTEDVGRYFREGEPIALLVSGTWHLRAVLTAEQLTRTGLTSGARVEFRPAASPAEILFGTVRSISPAGSAIVHLLPLTQLAGGDILIDPQTQTALERLFEVIVELPEANSDGLRYGMTGTLRLPAAPEPLATRTFRRVHRFLNQLAQN